MTASTPTPPRSRPTRSRPTSSSSASRSPTPDRVFELEALLRRGVPVASARMRRPASTRGSSTSSCRSCEVRREVEARPRAEATRSAELGERRAATRQARGLLRRPARPAPRARPGRRPRGAPRARASGPRSRPSTPARRSSRPPPRTTTRPTRRRTRSPVDARARRHLGLGPEPDRPGDRVRLLLRARGAGAARRGLRDDHGQLQPRDRVDGLRHRLTASTSSR